ncbi:MAG: hypothetical protein LBT24_05255 [Tannerella sp.]|jgi:hypothetical protein|nr:hypothetical protein [Tannerella sp.]
MKQKYYGSVSSQDSGIVFENQYASKARAIKELCRKTKEAARNSFDGFVAIGFTLFLDENIVASGRLRTGKRLVWKLYPSTELSDFYSTPLSGVRIC